MRVELSFATTKLARLCSSEDRMVRELGPEMARRLGTRLQELEAANSLAELRLLPQVRAHELGGDRDEQISLDLIHPKRLIIQATHPPPRTPEGGLDWTPSYPSLSSKSPIPTDNLHPRKEHITVIAAPDRQYRPDYAIPPGETVRSTLDALGMTQADLSRRTGLSTKHINQIIQGVAPISPDTALALERVLGVPARFWNALEANYQARQIRLREGEVSPVDAEWLGRLPVKELARRGFIEQTDDLAELRDRVLSFFGVASRPSWDSVWFAPEASFRRSPAFEADPYATAAWLRVGELKAATVEVNAFDRIRFGRALQEIRSIMTQPPEEFEPEMRRLCAESGVVLVITEEIKRSRANGATRWLSPTKALIQLSLRYRWEDVFWFSFFHEAGHVLLHGKRETFIDDGDRSGSEEEEANEFAALLLIPQQFETELLRIRTLAEAQLFARRLGIPPGVVVGRLQREKILGYNVGNGLRRRFTLVPANHS